MQTAARASGQLTLSVFLVTVAVQLEKMMRCSAGGLSRADATAGLNTTVALLPVRLTILKHLKYMYSLSYFIISIKKNAIRTKFIRRGT